MSVRFVDRLPPCLFGAHVGGGSEKDAGAGRVSRHRRRQGVVAVGGLVREPLGKTKVQNLDFVVRSELGVRGLEVPMNDSLLVSFLESLGDLLGDHERLVHRNRPPGDALRERLSGNELQDEVVDGARVLEPVNRGDVRVVQRREDFRLSLKAG
jgi:hypothetical protein